MNMPSLIDLVKEQLLDSETEDIGRVCQISDKALTVPSGKEVDIYFDAESYEVKRIPPVYIDSEKKLGIIEGIHHNPPIRSHEDALILARQELEPKNESARWYENLIVLR